MSFLGKSGYGKPSLAKPALIIIAALLVIGGIYSVTSQNKDSKDDSAAEAEVQSSGLDSDKKVSDVKDVEEVIAKWIEANPKAIIASVNNMQKKAMEEQMRDAQKNISSKKDELFKDKNSPSYSAGSYNITIVEFFDYACGYCKKAQNTIEELLKEDKKVRVVYKEFPILGQNSEELSQVALAVNLVDSSAYRKFHDALMKSTNVKSKDDAVKLAKSIGISEEKLNKALSDSKDKIAKIIQDNRTLGTSIGINGTPGFVIGEELVPGAIDLETIKEKIAAARKK